MRQVTPPRHSAFDRRAWGGRPKTVAKLREVAKGEGDGVVYTVTDGNISKHLAVRRTARPERRGLALRVASPGRECRRRPQRRLSLAGISARSGRGLYLALSQRRLDYEPAGGGRCGRRRDSSFVHLSSRHTSARGGGRRTLERFGRERVGTPRAVAPLLICSARGGVRPWDGSIVDSAFRKSRAL